MSDFAVQKPMRTISLGFGSASEAVVTRLVGWPKHCVFDILRNQAKTKDSCANAVQSLSLYLSLSLSLSLSAFTTCYQSLQTKIVRRAWSGATKHTKSYNIVRWSRNISDKYLLSDACHGRIQRGTGGPDPPENHRNIGFPSNIDPDPLKITKLPSQHSMVGHWHASKTPFQRRFADGPLVVHFSGISVLSHYPLWQNVLDPRMHAVRVNRARLKLNCRRT